MKHFTLENRIRRLVRSRGMTLIEVIVYVLLLSSLLVGYLKYAIEINIQNVMLSSEIENAYK